MRHHLATVGIGLVLVLGASACGGDDDADPSGGQVAVQGTDALAFEPSSLTTSAGQVTVELSAGDESEHTFVIEDLGDREVVAAAAGETATSMVELEPGTYAFYCDVPGHREAGMEGTLEVTG
ncbi:MAG: cupredoxin domain-containing protein [Actinobacteria bacterium]|nr:cupredoxin domain-containing protein [Actinomycetota bacterium]